MPLLNEFDDLVSQLMAQGAPRDRAEIAARMHLRSTRGMAMEPDDVDAVGDERRLERDEQIEIRKLFIAYGFRIYNLSQARATKQTPGLFDLWCVHEREPIAFWFDAKRPVGWKLSPAQIEFVELNIKAGVSAYYGDRRAAAQLLVDLGLAVRIDDRLEPARLYTPRGASGGDSR